MSALLSRRNRTAGQALRNLVAEEEQMALSWPGVATLSWLWYFNYADILQQKKGSGTLSFL
jgi:hypothetical protein